MSYLKTVKERFYQDPEWGQVEDLILDYITPLLDMSTIDLDKSAEDVKAQVIGRLKAYDSLSQFVQESKLINKPLPENKNLFR